MRLTKTLGIVLMGLAFSGMVLASSDDDEATTQMPKMNHGMMMDSEVMEQMADHQTMHEMMQQMMRQMPKRDYGSGSQHGMPMMGNSMGPGMMGPQMMQTHMRHMVVMEQHMEKIESLLSQILEAQKSR